MTTNPHFHEGQEVEVYVQGTVLDDKAGPVGFDEWRKAKIICKTEPPWRTKAGSWLIELPNGKRVTFKGEHIREATP